MKTFNLEKKAVDVKIKPSSEPKYFNSKKYMPAANAGKRGKLCTLFICEGDSARNFIESIIDGKFEDTGLLTMQGKIMNFKRNKIDKILQNKIFLLLANAIGIKEIKDVKRDNDFIPNYNTIIIAADQDNDGFHISGLVLNLFNEYCPFLLKQQKIKILKTPLVMLLDKNKKIVNEFYSFQAF
jgi:DNA gyrase/topoisomerase IV subunit B